MIELSLWDVALSLVPVIFAFVLYGLMVHNWTSIIWATFRMVAQLLAIGFALTAIFNVDQPGWVLLVISVMSLGAGWIAVRPIAQYKQPKWPVFCSVIIAGSMLLTWIMAVVIRPDPWFAPAIIIPVTGMVMANTMNAVSLCAERFWSERQQGNDFSTSVERGMTAAMIPQINSLLAVGLVSLPGMMTGQILSGVSPLVAVRYQIVIMAMILATAAIGSYLYLQLQRWLLQGGEG